MGITPEYLVQQVTFEESLKRTRGQAGLDPPATGFEAMQGQVEREGDEGTSGLSTDEEGSEDGNAEGGMDDDGQSSFVGSSIDGAQRPRSKFAARRTRTSGGRYTAKYKGAMTIVSDRGHIDMDLDDAPSGPQGGWDGIPPGAIAKKKEEWDVSDGEEEYEGALEGLSAAEVVEKFGGVPAGEDGLGLGGNGETDEERELSRLERWLEAQERRMARAAEEGRRVHNGFACDDCGTEPIEGTRFTCAKCREVDLCAACFKLGTYTSDSHVPSHTWYKIRKPVTLSDYYGSAQESGVDMNANGASSATDQDGSQDPSASGSNRGMYGAASVNGIDMMDTGLGDYAGLAGEWGYLKPGIAGGAS
ncbi:hypothetical protein M427DRAFT_54650 [Gonapodya prolifera JEL478]|uniref:ZZ-type domain-containing protein n=1 Tax=Gonapodya prolifera (strain JEL478) TaxID=1344416 RepID=A0A139ALP9_GONPJ|nr:hypothetical protein M427DRAFT_54650 [Gonapodya prolifera JEL478]|eukprot:KXS17365.1 hypothetical protein M427DRAFT_54650 [Gonapodya prolifera JEL478]